MEFPNLIEPNTKSFLFDKLKSCHLTRVNVYYYVLNISVFLIFSTILVCVLYYSNKHHLTEYEKQLKMKKDQEYILSKIRFFQEMQKDDYVTRSEITNLPFISKAFL